MADSEQVKPAPLTAHQIAGLYQELRSHYAARNARYQRLREIYRGEHWGGEDLPRPSGTGRAMLVVNYVRPTVDKTVQDLFGRMPAIQVLPPSPDQLGQDQAEGEEGVLYQTWAHNKAEIVFRRVAHNAFLLDQGVLYYWWDSKSKRVRFRSIPPENFYPLYDGEDLVECILVSRRLTRHLKASYPALAEKIYPDVGEGQTGEGEASALQAGLFDADRYDGDNIMHIDGAMVEEGSYTTVLDWYDRNGNWVRMMGGVVHKQNLNYGSNRVPVIVFPGAIAGDEAVAPSIINDIYLLNLYADKLLSQNADIVKRYANPTVIDVASGQSGESIRNTIQADGGVIPVKRDGDIHYLNWTGTPPDIQAQWERVMSAIHDLSAKPSATAYGQILSQQSGTTSNVASNPSASLAEEKMSVFGSGLIELNAESLRLYEKFVPSQEIQVSVSANVRPGTSAYQSYRTAITGREIAGWYENRIKWPSVLRVDDPVYVQNELAKSRADGSGPPKQSAYTTMENLGIENVQRERALIEEELQNPSFYPDRLKASTDAALAMSQGPLAPALGGLGPAGAAPPPSPELDPMLNATGNPNGSKSKQAPKTPGY